MRTVLPTVTAMAALTLAGASSAGAHTLRVHDEGRLHFLHSSGSQIIDEGVTHGTLPGRGRVRFTYTGNPTVTASFTIRGTGWTINGRATGQLHNPNSSTPSFRARLTLSGGSGRYAHASGGGELFGVFNRRTYALTVQAIGTLHY